MYKSEKKNLSIVLLVAFVGLVALYILFLNINNLSALQEAKFQDGNIVGEAYSLLLGKATCGTVKKNLCQTQQTKCKTSKGTWLGDCNKCLMKCSLSK